MVFRHGTARQAAEQLRDEMNRLFTGLVGNGWDFTWPGAGRGQPAVNVWDNGESIMVEAELPGVNKEQLDISVMENELTLKVDRPEVQDKNVTYHRRERPAGALSRVIRLPLPVNAQRVSAELRNGVLTITLPKAEECQGAQGQRWRWLRGMPGAMPTRVAGMPRRPGQRRRGSRFVVGMPLEINQ